MTRYRRRFVEGFPAHVVHRGNNGEAIFRCDSDLHFYWTCLKDAVDKFSVHVNAYVFMTNHVHLILTPQISGAISRAMHGASRRYSTYFNGRYCRKGMLWQERFFASLITTDRYLLACHRYIDMNPVRAGMVAHPHHYHWSSHRYFVFGEPNALVIPHPSLTAMVEGSTIRIAYRLLTEPSLDCSALTAIREAAVTGRPIGTPPGKSGPKPKPVPGTGLIMGS